VERKPLIDANSRVFAMGSCFAQEIRYALQGKGMRVFPDYVAVPFNPATQIFDKIPERDFIPHYDTFVIRQEFESMLGLWPDRAKGFWPVTNAFANQILNAETIYQEPYRKITYAKTPELLADLSDKVTQVMREGLEQADVVVITLGLTEVWRHLKTGKYLCRPPATGYGGGENMAEFRQSTFLENYLNMKAVFDQLFVRFPNKQVVLTVSPVPLEATYTQFDVGTANTESKSILRAVAGQICREYKNVTYFPSYEMATILGWPVFKEDGRHVLPEFAARVVEGFFRAFSR
jgi:hypothetical protein